MPGAPSSMTKAGCPFAARSHASKIRDRSDVRPTNGWVVAARSRDGNGSFSDITAVARARDVVAFGQQVHRLRAVEVPQLLDAQLDQPSTGRKMVGDELGRDLADEHVAGSRDGAQARGPVDRSAEVVAIAFDGFAGVRARSAPRPCTLSGHGSSNIPRCTARAAAAASAGRLNTLNVESPSPFDLSSTPPWLVTAAPTNRSWRSRQSLIRSGTTSHNRVEPTTSLRRNVMSPDGSSASPGACGQRAVHIPASHAIFCGDPEMARDACMPDITAASTAPMLKPLRVQSPAR